MAHILRKKSHLLMDCIAFVPLLAMALHMAPDHLRRHLLTSTASSSAWGSSRLAAKGSPVSRSPQKSIFLDERVPPFACERVCPLKPEGGYEHSIKAALKTSTKQALSGQTAKKANEVWIRVLRVDPCEAAAVRSGPSDSVPAPPAGRSQAACSLLSWLSEVMRV